MEREKARLHVSTDIAMGQISGLADFCQPILAERRGCWGSREEKARRDLEMVAGGLSVCMYVCMYVCTVCTYITPSLSAPSGQRPADWTGRTLSTEV
jgi:hypothetical protein